MTAKFLWGRLEGIAPQLFGRGVGAPVVATHTAYTFLPTSPHPRLDYGLLPANGSDMTLIYITVKKGKATSIYIAA